MTCRCGNEQLPGGARRRRPRSRATREAAARDGPQPVPARRCWPRRARSTRATSRSASKHGDAVSVELITEAGRLIGQMLAGIVNFFNPSLIVIGGGVAGAGDLLLATIRQTIYRRSLPLSTRDLTVRRSALDGRAGVIGAATMVANELFAREYLPRWLDAGEPRRTRVAHRPRGGRARRRRRRRAGATPRRRRPTALVSTGGSAPRSSSSSAVCTLTSLTSATAAIVEPGPIGVSSPSSSTSASPTGVQRSSTTSAWSTQARARRVRRLPRLATARPR